MGGIGLTQGTLHDCEDIAALHIESWRSAYRGILPASYLMGPLLPRGKLTGGTLCLPRAVNVAVFSW
jgi:hypothetical protein